MFKRLLKSLQFRLRRYFILRFIRTQRVAFCTFADGVVYTSNRLASEARAGEFFRDVTCHNPNTLEPCFFQLHRRHMQHARGFGFWCWKPWVIRRELQKLRTGDFLIYADSGCTLGDINSPLSQKKSQIYAGMQALLSKFYLNPDLDLVVPSLYEEHNWTIAQWTKADLLDHFSVLADVDTLNRFPVDANRLLLRHSPRVLQFLDAWCETAANFHLISDEPSTNQEHPAFIEHRHDQAIFNLLLPRLNWTAGLEIILHATRLKH
jgi:hypothetical protein